MSAPTLAVTAIHTDDANPSASKFRVSAVAGHDTALVTVETDTGNAGTAFDVGGALLGDLTPSMIPYLAAIIITAGSRTSTPATALGAVCGISRCGADGVMPLAGYGTVDTVLTVKRNDLTGADGDKTLNVFALVEPEGWL